MIGLGLSLQVNQKSIFYSLIVQSYVARVIADGGTIEAVDCVQSKLSL
jgi:hypothetical protein